jgi:DNA-binding transcriptional LysR family regulator
MSLARLQRDVDPDELAVAPALDRGAAGKLATPIVDRAIFGEAGEERIAVMAVGGLEEACDGIRDVGHFSCGATRAVYHREAVCRRQHLAVVGRYPPGMAREPGAPLDLRKLRYFVAVAEELHFGRAAERLYIAQPVLSRQIRKLEQELGVELLVRTSRSVALTPAGLQLMDEAKSLLAAAEVTQRRIGNVASDQAVLTIGFFIGDEFTAARKAFSARHPDVAIKLHRTYWSDQTDLAREGLVDVAFVHLPIDDRELELVTVRSEHRVAALPVGHAAAGKREVSISELADDAVIIQRGATAGWQAFHNVDPRPDGRHPRAGPAVDNLEEKLAHVAAGRAISFVPASVAAAVVQPGVVYVPVNDIPPIQVCLAWRASDPSPLVMAFRDCVVAARRQALAKR